MTSLILTIAISALVGGACGYWFARYRWQDQLLEMEMQRQDLRRTRLELSRERFQESTSRIHRPPLVASESSDHASEELEQLRLELTILKEDHRVEKELLQREIDELTTDDRPDLDVDEEEAVFVEVEADDESPSAPFPVGHEASNAEEHIIPEPETEESSFEAVNEDQNDEAATQEDMDAIFGAITEDGPSDEEEADVLGSSEAEDTKRESGIAPVPTDIESLFKAPRVEEPSVTPESNAMAESDSSSSDSSSSDSSSSDSEDVESAPDLENAPFAIHWNADRPGHHQDLDVKDGYSGEDLEEHAAIPAPDTGSEPATLETEQAPVEYPNDEALSESTIPVFRSLHDMLTASGVSLAHSQPAETGPSHTESQVWSPQLEESTQAAGTRVTDKALIQSIVSLDPDSFSLLDELGYASLTRLAQLSTSEVRRLAQVFRIDPDLIEQDWKPTATAHLNMQS